MEHARRREVRHRIGRRHVYAAARCELAVAAGLRSRPRSRSAPQPLYTIKPYAIANAQVDYGPAQGKWTATAGVTNLTNKFYYYQLFGGGAINVSSNVAPPREYFFSVRRDFWRNVPMLRHLVWSVMCLGASVAGAHDAPPSAFSKADPALDALIAPDAKLKTVASGFGFADTPLWIRGQKGAEGYLVAVSIIDNVVYKVALERQGLGVAATRRGTAGRTSCTMASSR